MGQFEDMSKLRIPLRASFSRCGFSIQLIALAVLLFLPSPRLLAGEKQPKENYGFGFAVDLTVPEDEVLDALEQVVGDGIIQGSKEYSRDQYIEKAEPATSSDLFPKWTGPGKVFYKVRKEALAPQNFKETQDEGTVAVRYIVETKDPSLTSLRIDAVFAEDFRRAIHPSNGSVENAEYKDIKDHIDTFELQKKQAIDSEKKREEDLAKHILDRSHNDDSASRLVMAQSSGQTLEQHVQELRRQVERVVKAPGAPLKSAPFRTATNLQSLPAGSEVIILISTSYWFGVETQEGQHGWIFRDDLDPLP
ncbi:MAG TPA: SH3 domain-containing protein [Terriglobales bacterium]|nr:SH3 domain-containing protein [Terriglobales bacterium]